MGVTGLSYIPVVLTIESKSDKEITLSRTIISEDSALIIKYHYITTTLISLLVSATPSTSSISLPAVVVPKPAIPAKTYHEYSNCILPYFPATCHCPQRGNLNSSLCYYCLPSDNILIFISCHNVCYTKIFCFCL